MCLVLIDLESGEIYLLIKTMMRQGTDHPLFGSNLRAECEDINCVGGGEWPQSSSQSPHGQHSALSTVRHILTQITEYSHFISGEVLDRNTVR